MTKRTLGGVRMTMTVYIILLFLEVMLCTRRNWNCRISNNRSMHDTKQDNNFYMRLTFSRVAMFMWRHPKLTVGIASVRSPVTESHSHDDVPLPQQALACKETNSFEYSAWKRSQKLHQQSISR